jgi:hypothetical protein
LDLDVVLLPDVGVLDLDVVLLPDVGVLAEVLLLDEEVLEVVLLEEVGVLGFVLLADVGVLALEEELFEDVDRLLVLPEVLLEETALLPAAFGEVLPVVDLPDDARFADLGVVADLGALAVPLFEVEVLLVEPVVAFPVARLADLGALADLGVEGFLAPAARLAVLGVDRDDDLGVVGVLADDLPVEGVFADDLPVEGVLAVDLPVEGVLADEVDLDDDLGVVPVLEVEVLGELELLVFLLKFKGAGLALTARLAGAAELVFEVEGVPAAALGAAAAGLDAAFAAAAGALDATLAGAAGGLAARASNSSSKSRASTSSQSSRASRLSSRSSSRSSSSMSRASMGSVISRTAISLVEEKSKGRARTLLPLMASIAVKTKLVETRILI